MPPNNDGDDESEDIMKTTIDMAREAKVTPDIVATHGQFFTRIEHLVALARDNEREACADKTGEFARKWWSIHCDSNKHMETTRKAHDDFCALQAAIRARGNT